MIETWFLLSFATENAYLGVAFRNLPRHPLKPLCPCASAVYGNCDIKMRYMGRGDAFIAKLEASKEKASRPSTSPAVKPSPQSPGRKSPLQSPRTTSPTQAPSFSNDSANSSESYKFSHNCGDNITMMHGGKKAKRIDALQIFNHGVVMTVQPLKDDELFEVRLDSKVPKWFGTLDIGATTVSPEGLEFPPSMDRFRQGVTFALCGDKILHNGKEMTKISKDLNDLTVGGRVGVMRKSDNSLHFFINGVNVGKQVKTLPPVLYGVVDVFGQAEEVTITGGTAETQSSNQDEVDSVSVMVRMHNIINTVKDEKFNDILFVVRKVAKDILEPYCETDDRQLRLKYGDHLSDISAPEYLTRLLRRVMDMGMETQAGWLGMCVIRKVFWNYADASLKMARGLGRSGSLKIMLNDLDTFGPNSSKNEKKKFLVSSAMNILNNCSKAAENRQILLDLRAIERISPFLKADDMETVVTATLTLAYISSDDQKKRLEAESRVISYLIGLLRNALNQSDLRGRSGGSAWSAQEIADGLGNLVVNEKNMEVMLERDVVPLMILLLEKGGDTEKECAANTLWIIAKTSKGKAKIKETPAAIEELTRLSKRSNQSVQAAAKRVLLELKETTFTQGSANKQPRIHCDYQEKCHTFKSSLKLSGVFFDPKFDRCFCTECHAARGDKLYYTRGQPAKDYGIPIGWCRFGLMVHPRAKALDVFNKWHVAFHGTRVESVSAILECGDVALGGRKLSEVDGHFNDNRKPTGFDTKQIFVSPSVRYSGHNCYAKPKSFTHPSTNKTYSTKAVLQLCINPDSYQVGPQTIGATAEIDPKFSNQEIEWSTKERGSIILYGLLVKLDEEN
ncbi:Neuralized-like protein 4 [Stylophora pistillata]|uniref:Neuralized-like protein 4 n=1 Tax=Stylophora pistillata TaxID=50429 RepID=A0A2B4RRA2_STYPI|nr:Neuralized-like protein 4 [Stylophora pistillata]